MLNIVYIILATLPLYLVKINIFQIPSTLLELEIYLAFIIFIVNGLVKGSFKKQIINFIKNPFFVLWLIFVFAGMLSVYFSPDKRISLGIFKAYFLDSSILFFMFVSLIDNKEKIKKSFVPLILSATILALIGLSQYFFLPQYLQDGRIRSLFSSPNYLSLYLTPVFFLLLVFIEKSKKEKLLPFILLMLVLITIFLTYSRGGWLGLILGLVFFLATMLAKKIGKNKIHIVSILFVIGLLTSFIFIIRGSYKFNLVPQSRIYSSDNIRKEIWLTSLDIGLHHWFTGVGLGNFQNYFGEYTKNRINYPEYITPNAVTPHNVFLNIWLQMGILGLLSFLGILGLFFLNCLNGIKKEFIFNIVLTSAMIAILGQGLVDSSIWKNDLMIIFWFLIGSSYIINKKG